jgi:hypothetical protein
MISCSSTCPVLSKDKVARAEGGKGETVERFEGLPPGTYRPPLDSDAVQLDTNHAGATVNPTPPQSQPDSGASTICDPHRCPRPRVRSAYSNQKRIRR